MYLNEELVGVLFRFSVIEGQERHDNLLRGRRLDGSPVRFDDISLRRVGLDLEDDGMGGATVLDGQDCRRRPAKVAGENYVTVRVQVHTQRHLIPFFF